MVKKIIIQSGLCIIVILALFVAKHSGNDSMENGAEVVVAHMSMSYSIEDMKEAGRKSMDAVSTISNKVGGAVDVITGRPVYGEPIDEKYKGNKTPVYAVAGGRVVAVGENEEIGKYVKIIHGDQAESLYGNLSSITVTTPESVKKGQIIGIYDKSNMVDFYYSLKEFQ